MTPKTKHRSGYRIKCHISSCRIRRQDNTNISFYKFPSRAKNMLLLRKWQNACKFDMGGSKPKTLHLCELHFDKSARLHKYLKKGTVPTLYLQHIPNTIDSGTLIDLVKNYPVLWEQTYKPLAVKRELWNIIGTTLGTSGIDAMRQWGTLRKRFIYESSKCKQEPQCTSKWLFYNKMSFISSSSDADVVEDDEHDDDDNIAIDHQQQTENIIPDLKVECDEPMVQVPNRLCLDLNSAEPSPSSTTTKTFDLDLNTSTKQNSNCYCNGDNEDFNFAMSLVPSLRCIPRLQKVKIQSKILDLIVTGLESKDALENVQIE